MLTTTTIRSSCWGSALAGLLLVSIAGCNKPAEPVAAPTPNTTVGAVLDDTMLTTKVKTALLGDSNMKSLSVSVETIQGSVRLSGFVDNEAQIDQALKVARAVEGVKDVRSDLSVKK